MNCLLELPALVLDIILDFAIPDAIIPRADPINKSFLYPQLGILGTDSQLRFEAICCIRNYKRLQFLDPLALAPFLETGLIGFSHSNSDQNGYYPRRIEVCLFAPPEQIPLRERNHRRRPLEFPRRVYEPFKRPDNLSAMILTGWRDDWRKTFRKFPTDITHVTLDLNHDTFEIDNPSVKHCLEEISIKIHMRTKGRCTISVTGCRTRHFQTEFENLILNCVPVGLEDFNERIVGLRKWIP